MLFMPRNVPNHFSYARDVLKSCSALLKLMGLLFHGTSFFLKLPLPTLQLMTLACLLFSSTWLVGVLEVRCRTSRTFQRNNGCQSVKVSIWDQQFIG